MKEALLQVAGSTVAGSWLTRGSVQPDLVALVSYPAGTIAVTSLGRSMMLPPLGQHLFQLGFIHLFFYSLAFKEKLHDTYLHTYQPVLLLLTHPYFAFLARYACFVSSILSYLLFPNVVHFPLFLACLLYYIILHTSPHWTRCPTLGTGQSDDEQATTTLALRLAISVLGGVDLVHCRGIREQVACSGGSNTGCLGSAAQLCLFWTSVEGRQVWGFGNFMLISLPHGALDRNAEDMSCFYTGASLLL
jgi:hypothetical protein